MMPRAKTPEQRRLIARRKRTAGDRRIAATHNTLALRRRRRTPPPPVIQREGMSQKDQVDLTMPSLVKRRDACPRGWWERLLAWLWRRFRRPPRRLYADSYSEVLVKMFEEFDAQRWRPLEVYRVRRLP